MSAQIFARLESHTRIARRIPSGGGGGGKGGGNNMEQQHQQSTIPTSTFFSTSAPLPSLSLSLSSSSPALTHLLHRTRIPSFSSSSFNFVLPPPVLSFDPFQGEEEQQEGELHQDGEERVLVRAAVEEDEDGTKHPLGEKNEEGKLAEEGMKRIAGWREATIKASLRRVDPSAGSVSKLGLRGVKLGPRRPSSFPRDPWSTNNTPASSPRPIYDRFSPESTILVPPTVEEPSPASASSSSTTRRASTPSIESPFNIPLPAPPPPPDFASSSSCNTSLGLISIGLGLNLAHANNGETSSPSSSSSAGNSSYEDDGSEIDTPLSLRHTALLPPITAINFTLPPPPPIKLSLPLPPPPLRAVETGAGVASGWSWSSSSIDRENPFGFPTTTTTTREIGRTSGKDEEGRTLVEGGGGDLMGRRRRRSWAEVAAGGKKEREKRFCVFGFEE